MSPLQIYGGHIMFQVSVSLLLIGQNLEDGIKYAVSSYYKEMTMPSHDLQKQDDIHETVNFLCRNCCSIDTDWIKLKCVDILNDNGEINITFAGMIPLDTKLEPAYNFISIQHTSDDTILKALRNYEIY